MEPAANIAIIFDYSDDNRMIYNKIEISPRLEGILS